MAIVVLNMVMLVCLSLYKSKESLSVCACVCVCVPQYLCGSGSDWPESFNMAAAWFKGVWRWICLDCSDTIIKLFHKCFTSSASIVHRSHHSHMRTRATRSLQSSSPRHTLRYKQIYTCSGASWTRILPVVWSHSRSVHLNWLLWINETKRVRTESVPVWGDLETCGQ